MNKVLEVFSGLSAFFAPYPAWVKVMLSLWGILSLALVLSLIFARSNSTVIAGENIEPPRNPSKPEKVEPPKPGPTIVFSPIFSPKIVVGFPAPLKWKHTDVPVQDKSGKKLTVSIGVLWDPYRWVFGSIEHIGIGERDYLPIERVVEGLPGGETRPIIAVGTASHENSTDRPEVESARALMRADKLVDLCMRKYPSAEIWSLNLGFFKGKSQGASSAAERRVILLVVTSHEPGADLPSGIRNALLKAAVEREFTFDARDYSNFSEQHLELKRRTTRSDNRRQSEGKAG